MNHRFLSLFAVLASVVVATAADDAIRKPGLQLYSLRAEFTKNVPATMKKVADFGFKNVELASTYNMPVDKFKELLAANGLTAVSGHFPFDRYAKEPEVVAKEAKALGLKYAGCAWIPHKGDFNETDLHTAVEVFNKAGEAMAKEGIKFFYHCHGYEYAPYKDGTYMDALMKETKPKLVAFQMDVFWVVHPGQDPVKWLQKYPGRWELMHLKDMKKGTQTGLFTGGTDVNNDVALGTGMMDWPAILAAAKKTGVKQYFIEDESAAVSDQLPQTLKYLGEVKF